MDSAQTLACACFVISAQNYFDDQRHAFKTECWRDGLANGSLPGPTLLKSSADGQTSVLNEAQSAQIVLGLACYGLHWADGIPGSTGCGTATQNITCRQTHFTNLARITNTMLAELCLPDLPREK